MRYLWLSYSLDQINKYQSHPRTAREYRPTVRPIHLRSSLYMREETSFLECLVTSVLLPYNPRLFNAAWLDVVIVIEMFYGYIDFFFFSNAVMQLSRKCDSIILRQGTWGVDIYSEKPGFLVYLLESFACWERQHGLSSLSLS